MKKDSKPALSVQEASALYTLLLASDPSSMTLRDWFAGQALGDLMADLVRDDTKTWRDGAWACYEMADAMLAERNKGTK